jgi:hypothetical protein
MGKKYFDTKDETLESSILGVWAEAAKKVVETNKNDKSDDGEGLDAVQPKAVKKKFKDRKDKDIDNDGDVDDSDKFLHKRRKAVSKAMKDEGNAFGKALKAAKEKGEKTFVVSGKTYEVKEGVEEFAVAEDIPSMEIGTNRYRDHAIDVTPGEIDPEWAQARDFKVASMKEALAKVWGLDEKKLDKEGHDEEDEELKPVKGSKSMTGGKVAKVDTKPKLESVEKYDVIDEWKKLNASRRVAGGDKRHGENLKEDELVEGKMKELHGYIEAGKSAEWIAKKMGVDVKSIKALMSAYESHPGDNMKENGKYMEMLAAACNGGGGDIAGLGAI